MKKELSPGLIVAIGAAAVVLLIGTFLVFGGASSGGEDPELARKQWEVEKARTPGGGTAPPVAPHGMAPGRDAELAAREQHSNK